MGYANKFRSLDSRKVLTFILAVGFIWSLMHVQWSQDLVHPGGMHALSQFFIALLNPDLSIDTLLLAMAGTWTTITYAVTGLCLALIIGIPCGIVASGTLVYSRGIRWFLIGSTRFLLAFFRSIHELVWAWLFVAAVGLSPIAAVCALGIPYGGILGRIYSELLQDVPQPPLTALRTTGAPEWKVFWFGRLPMALPDMLSYTFYRLECGVRSAAILSFVGLGGLGHRIQMSLDDLAYAQVWTYLFFLISLVIFVDVWSSLVRRRLTE